MRVQLIIIAFCATLLGCAVANGVSGAKNQFSVITLDDKLYLRYSSMTKFTISLSSDSEPRCSSRVHNSGDGKILIFEDKGAIWLYENGRGYGTFTAAYGIVKLLKDIQSAKPNVFRIGEYKQKDNGRARVFLSVTTESKNEMDAGAGRVK